MARTIVGMIAETTMEEEDAETGKLMTKDEYFVVIDLSLRITAIVLKATEVTDLNLEEGAEAETATLSNKEMAAGVLGHVRTEVTMGRHRK